MQTITITPKGGGAPEDLNILVFFASIKYINLIDDEIIINNKQYFFSSLVIHAGTDGSVWLNGMGLPNNSIGKDGDYYLDNASGKVYQKVTGVWVFLTNITGPQGIQGVQGNMGPQGQQGIQGPPAMLSITETTGANGMLIPANGTVVMLTKNITQAGIAHVSVSGHIHTNSNAAQVLTYIRKNAVNIAATERYINGFTGDHPYHMHALVNVAVGNVIDVIAVENSGFNTNFANARSMIITTY